MAAKKFVVDDVTATSKVSLDGALAHTISTDENTAKKFTVKHGGVTYGEFSWTTNNTDVEFKPNSALTGSYDFDVTGGTFKKIDFTGSSATLDLDGAKVAAAGIVTGSNGNDKVKNIGAITVNSGAGNDVLVATGAATINAGVGDDKIELGVATTVDAGDGNDVVKAKANQNGTIILGTGADTLDVATAIKVTLNAYDAYEGDVLFLSGENVNTTSALGNDGDLSLNGATTNGQVSLTASKVVAKDGIYKVVAKGKDAAITELYTAAVGAGASFTQDFSKSADTHIVNGADATKVDVTLGTGTDVVTLSSAAGVVDTVAFGLTSGANNDINGFKLGDDVLAMNPSTIELFKVDDNGTNTTVKLGDAQVTLKGTATGASHTGAIKYGDGKKLAYDDDAGSGTKIIAAADMEGATMVLGNAAGTTTIEVGATTHLSDVKKYKNIKNVILAASAANVEGVSLTGAQGKANGIDAGQTKKGVAVWGYSSAADSITLDSALGVRDTVWFSGADGTDTVTNFGFGIGDEKDVIYLMDVASLKDIKTEARKIKNGSAALTFAAPSTNNVVQMKLADQKIYNVVGDLSLVSKSVEVDVDDSDPMKLSYYAFAKGNNQITFKNGKASDKVIFNTLYTDSYTAGATVDSLSAGPVGSAFKGDLVVGAVKNVTTGSGTSQVWTFTKDDAAITAGTGKDTIWFAAGIDGKVNVATFDIAKDTAKFAMAGSLKDIAKDYEFKGAVGKFTITGKEKADSELTLNDAAIALATNAYKLNFVDGADKKYKALIGAGGVVAAQKFETDVNLYAGMATLEAGAAIVGKVAVRVGEKSRGIDTSDTYYITNDVKAFDASKSTAEFVIAGSSEQANTLKGGMTKNDLYGGGISADELHGHVAAVDTYWFGTGDGLDKVASGLDNADKVMLWNIKSSEIGSVKVELADGEDKITLRDSSMLTLTDAGNAAIKGGLTFTTGDGVNFKYDAAEKKLVKA